MVLCLIGSSWAQCDSTSYKGFRLSVGGNMGVAGMTMKTPYDGTMKPGLSFNAELAAYVVFSKHVGVKVGLNMAHVSSSYELKGVKEQQRVVDLSAIDYTLSMKKMNTYISMMYAQVPFQLALIYDHWYANLGFKLAIPMQVRSYSVCNSMQVSATMVSTGTVVNPGDPMADILGCRDYGNYAIADVAKDATSGSFQLLASVDFGFRIPCAGRNAWTIGLYGDYSLVNSEAKGSLLTAKMDNAHRGSVKVGALPIEKLGFFSAGIKVMCDFGLNLK